MSWWRLIFGALTVLALAWTVRIARTAPESERATKTGAGVYHVTAAAAMVYATLAGPPLPALGWALITLFVLDSLVVLVVAAAPRSGTSIRAYTADILPHLIMNISTAAMLAVSLR